MAVAASQIEHFGTICLCDIILLYPAQGAAYPYVESQLIMSRFLSCIDRCVTVLKCENKNDILVNIYSSLNICN